MWSWRLRKRQYFDKTCARGKWDDVLRYIKRSRHLDKATKTGSTVLHHVCCFQPPLNIVQEIVALYPGMIMVMDICGRLPLHEACRYKAPKEVVDFLADSYSSAPLIQDRQGKTPLHYAADAEFVHDYLLLDVVMSLSVSYPRSLSFRDSRGLTPVDIIASNCGRCAPLVPTMISGMASPFQQLI
jgi:ankyrin repeat protein